MAEQFEFIVMASVCAILLIMVGINYLYQRMEDKEFDKYNKK